jgi:O-acetyl-ADP-ribose deacetylase (regulator of RNase III)
MAGPGDHGMHERQDLAPGANTSGTVSKTHGGVNERLHARAGSQCRHHDRAGVGHQSRFVEGHLQLVETVRYWLH